MSWRFRRGCPQHALALLRTNRASTTEADRRYTTFLLLDKKNTRIGFTGAPHFTSVGVASSWDLVRNFTTRMLASVTILGLSSSITGFS